MYHLNFTTQFKKDFKKIASSKFDMKKLEEVFVIIEKTGTLPVDKYKTHLLKGNYKGHHEAHILSDLLLIWYKVDKDINFVRVGSHSELFK